VALLFKRGSWHQKGMIYFLSWRGENLTPTIDGSIKGSFLEKNQSSRRGKGVFFQKRFDKSVVFWLDREMVLININRFFR
jgi:hypothetical protein